MSKKTTLPYNAALMEAITDMVFIVSVNDDSSLTSEFFNQAVFERTHLTKENLGKTFYENHSPEVARILNEHYGKVLEQKKRIVYEDAFTCPTGEKNYSKSTLTPLFDEAGICTHIIGLVKDLTEERRAGLESEQALEYLKESRSRYRSLFENNTDAIFSLDLNRQILTGNPTVEKTTDCLLNDLIGNGLLEYIPKNDEELVETYFQLALDGVSQDFRTKFLGEGDKQIPVLVHFSPIEVKGEVVGVYATLKDMTVLDKMVSQYIEIENRFRIIAENAHDVIVLMDHKGEAIYVSPSSKRVYGLDPEEYLAKPPFDNVHPDDIPQMRKAYSQAVEEAKTYISEVRLQHKTRGWIWAEVQGTPVFDEHQQFVHMLTITQDITLHKERENQLHYYAYHDSLTGLPNRRFLKERLLKELTQPLPDDVLTVFLLDIDYFKEINDQLGHDVGDSVIQEFGRRLLESIGEGGVAVRLGGDEFILVLPKIKTVGQAEEMAQKIQQMIAKPWENLADSLEITISMGIAITPKAGATVSSILKNADLALYESKGAGRSTYRIRST